MDGHFEDFTIGNKDFKDKEHYDMANRDLENIEMLRQRYDWNKPEDAVELYKKIRSGEIKIEHDEIRQMTLLRLSDCFSQGYQKGGKKKIFNVKKMLFRAAIAVAIVVTMCAFSVRLLINYREKKSLESMSSVRSMQGIGDLSRDIMPSLVQPFLENQDLMGWITVEGTEIDYPVLQTVNDQFYFGHDFFKNADPNGMIFIDSQITSLETTKNITIYGKNCSNGRMFGALQKYRDQEYYRQHKLIRFSTLYDTYHYEIVSVCQGNVHGMEDFWLDIVTQQLYKTDAKLDLDDTFITLSACGDNVDDGDIYIVAKKLSK